MAQAVEVQHLAPGIPFQAPAQLDQQQRAVKWMEEVEVEAEKNQGKDSLNWLDSSHNKQLKVKRVINWPHQRRIMSMAVVSVGASLKSLPFMRRKYQVWAKNNVPIFPILQP